MKKDLSFSSLVRAIDEKWGHTYEDVKLTEADWDLSLFMEMISPLNDKAEQEKEDKEESIVRKLYIEGIDPKL